jgi:hypothetical protein
MHMPSIDVIQAIAVTAELCGRTFSPAAARVFAGDLDGFPDAAVLIALTRCRKEVKGLLTVQDVVSRIDDGRPGVEQAWAMLPQDEETSTVWTEEMAQAWGVASPLLVGGDRIGARMAFKEAYAKAVTDARDRKLPPKWTPSFGRDVPGRQAALAEAVRHNRLSLESAVQLLPYDAAEGLVRSLGARHPLLAAPSVVGQTRVKALLAGLKGQAA